MDNTIDKFLSLQSDFYHYMISDGKLATKTASDYLSRLKYLAQKYTLDLSFSQHQLEEIIANENISRIGRAVYNSPKAMGDFKAGLTKFLHFVQSGYIANRNQTIINNIQEIQHNNSISVTERENLVRARIGQGIFRKRLIETWGGCSVTGCNITDLLVASHIKPWYCSTNEERLDVNNGLLLIPNLDRLFDRGYISFKENGKILISNHLPNEAYKILGIHSDIKLLKPVNHKCLSFLNYHRENCFIG